MKLLCFVFVFVANILLLAEPLNIKVSASSAILINAKTGAILYEKKAHDSSYPASLTKIATCLYAIKNHHEHLDAKISCPHHCLRKMHKHIKIAHHYQDPAYFLEPDGTHFWIRQGEKVIFRDLLYGMMLISGNDAANYVAYHIGGTIPEFMKGMNHYLKEIGCKNTHFMNPHGLHHPQHVTTAYDLALITKEALKEKLICQIASTKQYERRKTNLQPAQIIYQHNSLLKTGKFFYPQAMGMKTGYTKDAGYCFSSVACNGERILIAILLGEKDSSTRFFDAIRLFEAAFNEKKQQRFLFKKEENIFKKKMKKSRHLLQAALKEDVNFSYYPSEEPSVSIELKWKELSLPIKKESDVGVMHILNSQGDVVGTFSLIATQEVKKSHLAMFWDVMQGKGEFLSTLSLTFKIFFVLGIITCLCGIYHIYHFTIKR